MSSSSNSKTESTHHRLYDFAKSALIRIFVLPYAAVCDLYCGNGADMDKFEEAHVGHYIGIDNISDEIRGLKEVWENEKKAHTADFFEVDPCVENLEGVLKEKNVPVDIVCCLQHLQLCFETEERARSLLCNISAILRPGGYFFGITPDSSTIWAKYQKNVEASHNRAGGMKPNTVPNYVRSESYMITFEVAEEKFPLFGKRYQLQFTNDVVAETHCLVHFPSLIRLAREAGLEYVEIQNLTEFYDDNRMQFASMIHKCGPNLVDAKGKLLPRSFDVLGLYTAFIFQKPDPDTIPPVETPPQEDEYYDEDWQDSEKRPEWEPISPVTEQAKGILGTGPSHLRYIEPLDLQNYLDSE